MAREIGGQSPTIVRGLHQAGCEGTTMKTNHQTSNVGIVVLGPMGLIDEDRTFHPISGQQGLVLALLAATYPNPVAVDILLDELWPGRPPKSAATGVRVVINRLRDRLAALNFGLPDIDPATLIVHRERGYQLGVESDQIDHLAFTALAERAEAEAEHPDRVAELLAPALDMWRGRAFEPHDESQRLAPLAARLDAQRCDAEERMADALLGAGRNDRAAVLTTALVEAEPYRERRWGQLMLALYRSDRQAEALQAAQQARSRLGEDLGVDIGPTLKQLELDILNHEAHLDHPKQPTTTLDRSLDEAAVEEFNSMLRFRSTAIPRTATSYVKPPGTEPWPLPDATPLLTITGPPGVGKSRLAARLASGQIVPEREGQSSQVLWLDLADEVFHDNPGDALPAAVLGSLGLRPTAQTLAEAVDELLGGSPTLLVLDNAEHAADAVAIMAEQLLDACVGLRVLVTSRIPLACRSEKVFGLSALNTDDAVKLLIDRAPIEFDRNHSREDLAHLVEQVDRLPLAIELIAPHLSSIPPAALAARLERSLEPAAGRRLDPRHQSLQRAIEWSVQLLNSNDHAVLAPAAVMAGGFQASDVSRVIEQADNPDVLRQIDVSDSLQRLVDHSLLRRSRSGPTLQWTMPNTVRTFVGDQVESTGTSVDWAGAHGDVQLALAQQLKVDLLGEEEARAVTEFGRIADQLSAAHRRFVERGDVEASCALSLSTWEYIFFRQDYARYHWLDDTLRMTGVDELPNHDELLAQGALAAWAQDNLLMSERLASRAEAVAAANGKPVPLAAYKARLNVAIGDDRPAEAATLLDRLLAQSSQQGHARYHADNLTVAAIGFARMGFAAEARKLAVEAQDLATSTGNPTAVAWSRIGLAAAELEREPARSARSYSSAARLAQTVHNRWVYGMAATGLVSALRRRGRSDQARGLLLEVTDLWGRARQHGQIVRVAQEAVLLLGHRGASANELSRAADLIDRIELLGQPVQLLPDEQIRFNELATKLAGQGSSVDLDQAPKRSLARAVVAALID